MTQPAAEQLEVAQADRDAAADRLENGIPEKFRNIHPATHTAKAIRKGKMDGHPWVQDYARHRILAIQATEARMAAAVEWQDIATAPRDGTAVLVYNDRGVHRCWWDEDWGTEGFWMIDVMKDDFPLRGDLPTHWLPLPAPPAIRIADDGQG